MRRSSLLPRPKGMPLLVCECTRPRPWPLFTQQTVRTFELPTQHGNNMIYVNVAWHGEKMKACGRACAFTRFLKVSEIQGRCPQCGNFFRLILQPTSVPNHLIYLQAVGVKACSLKVYDILWSKHPVRFTEPEERSYKEKRYLSVKHFSILLEKSKFLTLDAPQPANRSGSLLDRKNVTSYQLHEPPTITQESFDRLRRMTMRFDREEDRNAFRLKTSVHEASEPASEEGEEKWYCL